MDKLPIKEIALEAFKLPVVRIREWIKFAALPIALGIASSASFLFTGSLLRIFFSLFGIVCAILSIPALLSFSVAWYRLVVLGPQSVSRRGMFMFGRPEWKLLLAGFLIILGSLPLAAIPVLIFAFSKSMALVILSGSVSVVVLLYVLVRLSFLLLEVALQRYQGLRSSWRRTRGHVAGLLLLSLIAGAPFALLVLCVGLVTGFHPQAAPAGGYAGHLFVMTAQSIINSYANAVFAGVIALAYKFVKEHEGPQRAAA